MEDVKVNNNELNEMVESFNELHESLLIKRLQRREAWMIKTILENTKIKVNSEFILMAFQIIGSIAQKLEASYWVYKKNKYNIK